ncbi:Uncharacterized protein PECH_006302 [Penicillium ucsense]|uniref:Ubiquitin carboxyl-terminal hydrolase 19 n=1 Tax=Penicillium ucsense TaxID=2839758 RepID=A0A8J8W8Z5_9EURO|nr:Uncharacterized protein PECM_000345 [Penicillium ucsense]KAF7739098.1 Uncharacterized protein PECH_006302 [Penicillium ucsense]
MDAQYPFATRDDLWRVFDELKGLHVRQFEQSERIARLEKDREEHTRLKNVWASSLSPLHSAASGPISSVSSFNPQAEPFKGFDQGHSATVNPVMPGADVEYEPRRGASRANSVRFDESAIHGYNEQTSRSSHESQIRPGRTLGGLPMTERSSSCRSDGRISTSGLSMQSTRSNSLRLDTSSRMMDSSLSVSPLTPPPGLFLLGPVPSVIRCWLTMDFTNETLLYAAVCSGSFVSSLGSSLIHKLSLEDQVFRDGDGRSSIKLNMWLPEASVHASSSGSSSPNPQVPSLTVHFLVHDTHSEDESIQIILGSDVLRCHNADIMFSQDKMTLVDENRSRISVPLVRPEKDWVFKLLRTAPDTTNPEYPQKSLTRRQSSVGIIGQGSPGFKYPLSAPASIRASVGEADAKRPVLQLNPADSGEVTDTPGPNATEPKTEASNVQTSWRRGPRSEPSNGSKPKARPMTVLKPMKSMTRVSSGVMTPSSQAGEAPHLESSPWTTRPVGDSSAKMPSKNPAGDATAFPWLNSYK